MRCAHAILPATLPDDGGSADQANDDVAIDDETLAWVAGGTGPGVVPTVTGAAFAIAGQGTVYAVIDYL